MYNIIIIWIKSNFKMLAPIFTIILLIAKIENHYILVFYMRLISRKIILEYNEEVSY